ncbi:caspase family protein [bacterium]|nr:caspase family protein [bacterium]
MKNRKQERPITKYRMFSQLVSICFCLLLLTGKSYGAEEPVTLVLFRGDVYLLDQNKQKHPARIGQEVSPVEYPWVETSPSSHLFLQAGKKMVELKTSGVFLLADVFKQQASVFENTLVFLKNLVSPRDYITQSRVRGGNREGQGEEDFEEIWLQVALEPSSQPTQLRAHDLIAAAAWFQQQQKPARVAYILERLNSSPDLNNAFIKQLRIDSLKEISLDDINQELEISRLNADEKYSPGKYKALLIGINEYRDSNWQSLKTPIRDIKELKRVLTSEYLFEEQDVILIENATYEEIISAFNNIKQMSDEDTNLLVYYAGHGYYPPGEDEGYWIPSDAGEPNSQRLFLPTSTILSKIKSIQSRHTLVMADSCFSGSLIRRTRGAEIHSRYFRDLSTRKSRQIITSGGLEPVSDQGWDDNSVFAGKLLDILSQKRTEPISASELALNLRKEVKNAMADQTPEYGRLHIADDEIGEFFFVRKDQELSNLSQLPQEEYNIPVVSAVEEEDTPWVKINRDGYRLNYGFGFHMAVLNYKFSYDDDSGTEQTESGSTALSGTVMHLGVKRTLDQFSYEVTSSFGQLSTSAFNCQDEDKQTEFCTKYANSSTSGRYLGIGVFAVYNVLPKFKVDVEVGGSFMYQRYSFNRLLDAENLNTSSLAACGRLEINYLLNHWFIGGNCDFCMQAYETDGTLNDYSNQSLSDLQIPFNMHVSLIAGYKF